MKISFLLLVTVFFSYWATAQKSGSSIDCSIVKQGRFKYLDIADTTAYFDVDGENHTEYHQNGKYYIKSKLKWLDDCRYEMKMIDNTIPGFPYKPGDVMIVVIKRVEENLIFYTAEVNGEKWGGRMVKLK